MKRITLLVLMLLAAVPVLAKDTAKKPDAKKAVNAATASKGEKASDAAIAGIDAQIAAAKLDKSGANWRLRLPQPTLVAFDPKMDYVIVMKTNKGPIEIRLRPDVAPMHVTNFIYLARMGFYDGLAFHRVITGFMAQGGDPLGNGMGGPGYQFAGEFKPSVKHDRPGMLSMANAGPGTDGSQFFLTFVPTPWLDGKHTLFGEVISGMETLKALEAAGSQNGRTSEPLSMTSVTVDVRAKATDKK